MADSCVDVSWSAAEGGWWQRQRTHGLGGAVRQQAEQQELEDFAVRVAVGEFETADIARWFESHTRRT